MFYAVRAMGAGDLKLLAALGSLAGPRYAITILLATAIAGGVLALVYAATRGRTRETLTNVGSVMKFHAWGRPSRPPRYQPRQSGSPAYAVRLWPLPRERFTPSPLQFGGDLRKTVGLHSHS